MKKRKILALLLVMALAVTMTACGGNEAQVEDSGNGSETEASGTEAEEVTIRIATVISGEESPTIQALRQFKENVEAASDGRIEVQLFTGGQLGNAVETLDQARSGDIEMVTSNPLTINTTITDLAALDQYFLFDDYDHAFRFLEGEGGQMMLDAYQQMGLQGVAYFPLGFRQFTNSVRPIETVEDLEGLRIRGYNPIQIAAWEAVGCNLSSVDWGELFTAMQQNLIDGQEGAITSFYEARFYEVQEYVSLTNHIFSTDILVASEEFMNSLSDADRELIENELENVVAWHWEEVVTSTESLIDMLADEYGTQFNEVPEETIEELREIMGAVTQERIAEISGQEILDTIIEYAEETR